MKHYNVYNLISFISYSIKFHIYLNSDILWLPDRATTRKFRKVFKQNARYYSDKNNLL